MSPYAFPGLVSGIVAFQLVLWGLVASALAGLRLVLVRGLPGRGHVARGILAGSLVVVAAGLVLGALSRLLEDPRPLDLYGAPGVALAAAAIPVWLARRAVRRSRVG